MTTTFILEDPDTLGDEAADQADERAMQLVEATLSDIADAPWNNVARMHRSAVQTYRTLYPLETVITFAELVADDSEWIGTIQAAFTAAWDDLATGEPHKNAGPRMILSIELTDTEYHELMDSLHEAVIAFGGYWTRSNRERSVHALELEHLRTLLAEAAAPKEDQ